MKEFRRETNGRSCSPSPRPWQKLRPKAAISVSKPISVDFGNIFATLSVVTPGLSIEIAPSIHWRARW
jgi:hypothetical protein